MRLPGATTGLLNRPEQMQKIEDPKVQWDVLIIGDGATGITSGVSQERDVREPQIRRLVRIDAENGASTLRGRVAGERHVRERCVGRIALDGAAVRRRVRLESRANEDRIADTTAAEAVQGSAVDGRVAVEDDRREDRAAIAAVAVVEHGAAATAGVVVAECHRLQLRTAHPGKAVVVTGGEPLIYNLDYLTSQLQGKGIKTFIETSGAYPLSGHWDWICLSPKKFKGPTPEIARHAMRNAI